MSDTGDKRRIVPPRWLWSVWLLVLALIVLIRGVLDMGDAGLTNVVTGLLVVLTALVSLAWFVFRSGHPPAKVRLGTLAVVVGVLVVGGSLSELQGWTGEMVPIFGLRLGSASEVPVPAASGTPVDLGSATPYDFPAFLAGC